MDLWTTLPQIFDDFENFSSEKSFRALYHKLKHQYWLLWHLIITTITVVHNYETFSYGRAQNLTFTNLDCFCSWLLTVIVMTVHCKCTIFVTQQKRTHKFFDLQSYIITVVVIFSECMQYNTDTDTKSDF